MTIPRFIVHAYKNEMFGMNALDCRCLRLSREEKRIRPTRIVASLLLLAVSATLLLTVHAESPRKTDTNSPTSNDPEFEKHVNLKRLRDAWNDMDAAQLTDVAVDFAVAERRVGRAHKAIAVHDVLETALRLAIENGDRETLTRIEEIAIGRRDDRLISLLKLASPSRAASSKGWYSSTKGLTPDGFGLYTHVKNVLKMAQVTGDTGAVDRTLELISKSPGLSSDQKKDLQTKVLQFLDDVPASASSGCASLVKLVGPARRDEQRESQAEWQRLSQQERDRIIQDGLDSKKLEQMLGSGSRRTKTVGVPEGGGWTLMIYWAADTNLERAMMDNVEELIRVGPAPNVNVLLLADRHPRDDNEELEEEDEGWKPEKKKQYTNREVADAGNWSGAKMFRIQKDSLELIKDFGDVNSGDGQTLKQFLELSVQGYPAAHYGLVIGGHGAAWENVCPDETAEEKEEKYALTMMEVRDAIDQGVGAPLDLLAFDCCLMANFEVYNSLAASTHVIAASEELAPGAGWNYASLLRTLTKNPNITGLEVGVSMGEAFVDYFAKADPEEYNDTTFSVVDMDKWSAVDKAVNQLSRSLGYQLTKDIDGAWLKIARAASDSPEYASGRKGLIDLGAFSNQLSLQFDNPNLKTNTERLKLAIDEAIAFNHCGKDHADSNGISIYLPHKQIVIRPTEGKPWAIDLDEKLERYSELPLAVNKHAWYPFVQQASKLSQVESKQKLLGEIESETTDGTTELVLPVLDPSNLESARFLLSRMDGDQQIDLGQSSVSPANQLPIDIDKAGELSAAWDGRWFTLMLGKQTLLCPAVESATLDVENETVYVRKVTIEVSTAPKAKWTQATLMFTSTEEDSESWIYQLGWINDDEKTEIDLANDHRLRSFATVWDTEGEGKVEPDTKSIFKITDPTKLTLSLQSIPAGKYLVGFTATNLSGRIADEKIEIEHK